MIIKLAICDDEITQINYLSTLVSSWAKMNEKQVTISTFESAEAFYFAYEEDKSFDILLLDIQMKNMDGVTLAKEIRKSNDELQIIFITGFPDFIAEGYEVSALHYLMKPVSEQKLCDVLTKACTKLSKTDKSILLTINGESVRIPVGDILYVEAFSHSVLIKTTKESFEAKLSIGEMEKLLGSGFIRCHRSYIVGLKYIKRITKTDVILDDGKLIPLSRRLYDAINRAFIRHFKGDS